MLPLRLSVAFLLSFLIGLGLIGDLSFSEPFEHSIEAWVAVGSESGVAAPDTLRPSVKAGEPLILSLPDRLGTMPVDHYTLIRGPALSGVADRSFAWLTRDVEPGTYDILLRAVRSDAPPDTLVLQIDVQS